MDDKIPRQGISDNIEHLKRTSLGYLLIETIGALNLTANRKINFIKEYPTYHFGYHRSTLAICLIQGKVMVLSLFDDVEYHH